MLLSVIVLVGIAFGIVEAGRKKTPVPFNKHNLAYLGGFTCVATFTLEMAFIACLLFLEDESQIAHASNEAALPIQFCRQEFFHTFLLLYSSFHRDQTFASVESYSDFVGIGAHKLDTALRW